MGELYALWDGRPSYYEIPTCNFLSQAPGFRAPSPQSAEPKLWAVTMQITAEMMTEEAVDLIRLGVRGETSAVLGS